MIKFSSVVDSITFEKIRSGTKTVKFYLCDDKHSSLLSRDCFVLINNSKKLIVRAQSIATSKNLKNLIESFSLQKLGEDNYSDAYLNVKQWFSDEKLKKYSVMAVSVEIFNGQD